MKNTMPRTELLASFQGLQAQFDDSLKQAQAHEEEFEALRRRFAGKLSAHLRAAKDRLPASSPVHAQVLGFIDTMKATQK